MVRNPPAMQETQVQSLDWENPLEKEMATHSSILAWRIPQTEEPGRLQSMESQRVIYVCACVYKIWKWTPLKLSESVYLVEFLHILPKLCRPQFK